MRVWDLSLALDETTPLYPGLERPVMTWLRRIEAGDACNLSKIALTSHVGTHVDTPLHYRPGGARLEDVALDRFVGPAKVLDLSACPDRALGAAALRGAGLCGGIVLLKTRNSSFEPQRGFRPDYTYLSREGAEAVVKAGVTTLGIDYVSVDPPQDPEKAAHHTLLGAGVIIFEGLVLAGVPAGEYLFVGLPLRVTGAEGVPARAVLLSGLDGAAGVKE